MALPHPEYIAEDDVSDLIDGRGSPTARSHYEQCQACQTYVAQQQQVEHALRRSASTCPTAAELVEYMFGGLPPREQARIAEHRNTCADCRAEMADLTAYLTADQPQPPAAQPVRRRAASWTTSSAALAHAPTSLLVETLTLLATVDDLQIRLSIKRTADHRFSLQGQLATMDDDIPFVGSVVEAEAAISTSTTIDEFGYFQLVDLHAGLLHLVLRAPSEEIVLPPISLE